MKRLIVCLAWLAAVLATALPAQAQPVLLVLGDSLSAEYGLPRDSGWVKRLERRLAEERIDYRVVNASISGETTAGGRTRLPALLAQHKPAVVVIELGANDGLRGLPIPVMQDNLRKLVRDSQAAGARVLLVGMHIPPNYGREYAERFHASFARVATDTRAALLPFFFDGFAEDLGYFQPDRIHPNEQAQDKMLANVWPQLRPLLSTRKPR